MKTTAGGFAPKTVVIYSVGLLGGSIGLGLKASGFTGRIVGLSSAANIATALSLGCIDEGHAYSDFEAVLKIADRVFLCPPIHEIVAVIGSMGKLAIPHNCVVTDVGSTKSEIMTAAGRSLPPHVHFIGGHPMAGSEKRGPSSADPYMFQNAVYVLTPGSTVPEALVNGFAEFLETYLGCRHMVVAPDTHDTIAATVSHVPHLLAVALVNVAAAIDARVPGTLSLAAGGFRDMTRIASAPFAMWRDILATNRSRIDPVIDDIVAELIAIKGKLSGGGIREDFDAAAATRTKISSSNKGFIKAPNDVFVVVKDQPGMIALMATACAEKRINIKDIEVLKVRENEAGTIRLAFETKAIAGEAVGLLRKLGLTAWERE